ncbi:phosphoesterase [Puia dinghuensis]|uniref:Phosphoesterase n=2 Tax=Puia dinghuensis TaxID=1792502 RepID=A0A8J2UHG1_9BACT|nr:phosphoesterase [Puia dinghuensis]
MQKKALVSLLFFLPFSTLIAQKTANYRYEYDDSTLQLQGPATLMSFNRLIQSAGQVITYGDSTLENHTLDFAILPDSQHIAVEGRYDVVVLDIQSRQIVHRWSYRGGDPATRGLMSTYSGIKAFGYEGHTYIAWGAGNTRQSAIMIAEWDGTGLTNVTSIRVDAVAPAATALPNDVAVQVEAGIPYLYVVLNGNNQLLKIRFTDRQVVWTAPAGVAPYGVKVVGGKVYVTNWAGPLVTDTSLENAGTPWGSAYTNPVTGGTARGSLSIIDAQSGGLLNELPLGLHPNAIACSPDSLYLYICNGNSDNISVVDVRRGVVTDSIPVGLFSGSITYYGSSPNALQPDKTGTTLYVTNGFDNAVCVIRLGDNAAAHGRGRSVVEGYIPTEAYPGGITLLNNDLYVANIEAKGSRVLSPVRGLKEGQEGPGGGERLTAYTIHQELASLSIIPVPTEKELKAYTKKVQEQSLFFRLALTNQPARQRIAPRPVPERIGEPSVFKHVVYIIKENKTYDQVYGDFARGRGMSKLCVYGDSVTPNQHRLSEAFSLLDNYYASGKCSAEGHQWTDAAMVSDYIEKSVRAWFRSYPHRQEDAMVYNRNGFIWNNALDHGKKVRVYGEACTTKYDHSLRWSDIYQRWLNHEDQGFTNTTTIARLRPIISPAYPDCDNLVFTDQLRADIFIDDLKRADGAAGDSLPDLMVLSLPNDHTAGLSPSFPAPQAMVADNDLAVGRIIEAITHSRFWDSTVVFITEDDSQSGWDHISPYRTTGLVISPYSVLSRAIHTNYNQTGMVRTIEQILGIPPMNVMDATALPLFDCFSDVKSPYLFAHVPNMIPLDKMNKPLAALSGKAAYYARVSANQAFKDVDGGDDEMMNKILWFAAKGDERYPGPVVSGAKVGR